MRGFPKNPTIPCSSRLIDKSIAEKKLFIEIFYRNQNVFIIQIMIILYLAHHHLQIPIE
jgi:hypothetical protein